MLENCKRSASSQKGDPSNPGNYRPIAICSNLAKVMKSILNHKLMKHLENNSLLNMVSGKNRSTANLLALLTETWNTSVHFFVVRKVVALDISKAFERVWQQGLISKLKSYGIGNTFIQWPSDFLYNCSIRVAIDGVTSHLYSVNSEVSQGSVIFPTLFLLFLNDLLCLTTNPSSLCHSYSYNAHPNLNKVAASRNYIYAWHTQLRSCKN